MNTIYYANLKTGKREQVTVGQGSGAYIDQTGQQNSYGRLPLNHSKRRLLMPEADAMMAKKGFVRWPRKKPLPIAVKKAA